MFTQSASDPRLGEGSNAVRAENSRKKAEFEQMRNFIMYGFDESGKFDDVLHKAAVAAAAAGAKN